MATQNQDKRDSDEGLFQLTNHHRSSAARGLNKQKKLLFCDKGQKIVAKNRAKKSAVTVREADLSNNERVSCFTYS